MRSFRQGPRQQRQPRPLDVDDPNVMDPPVAGEKCTDKDGTQISACEKTGATDSTVKWNLLLEDIMIDLVPVWRSRNFGIARDGHILDHAIWADNIFLYSTQTAHLREMVWDLTVNMHQRNLFWKKTLLLSSVLYYLRLLA